MSIAARLICAMLALGIAMQTAGPVHATEPLVVDLSSDEVAITTGFAGTELLLFGAKDPGGDVVVVIRGPERDEVVRRRERVAGVWVNGASMIFRGLPAFYLVAATKPVEELAPIAMLEDRRIGVERLALSAATDADGNASADYRKALIRNKIRQRLYAYDPTGVRVVGDRLFRTTVVFPANVPTGPYRVEAFLFDGGREIGRREATLVVRKVGIEAGVFNFAHQQSALYGVIAILIALGSGWLAGAVFRT